MRSLWIPVGLGAALLVFTGGAWAQVGGGQVTGLVTDAQAAAVPGVTVTATNTATGVAREAVTNVAGAYTLPGITAHYHGAPKWYALDEVEVGRQWAEQHSPARLSPDGCV